MQFLTKQTFDKDINAETITGYTLLDIIGRGGFGIVYRAQQLSTSQIVAVKILNLDENQNLNFQEQLLQRFEREILLCSELRHPNIVTLLDKGTTNNNRVFAVFEYVPGITLKQYLSERGPLSAVATWVLMSQVLDGLANAHQKGIIHRDLKPQNIMVTVAATQTQIKILDFGIGAILPKVRKQDYLSLTLSNESLGTPAYCAPEQLRGEQLGTQADIYAWTLVFLECLTAETVIQGKSTAEIFHKQLETREVPLPSAIIGHPLAVILRSGLKKNAGERCFDAKKLWHDINKLNLSDIVGSIAIRGGDHCLTNSSTLVNFGSFKEKRQITVLSCRVCIVPEFSDLKFNENNIEAIEIIQQTQLNLCCDIVTRFGGEVAGKLGDRLLVYFGYPHATDSGARRAARASLEIINAMKVPSTQLDVQLRVQLHTRIGLHTGLMIVNRNEIPTGQTSVIATRLETEAESNSILASSDCVKCLDRIINFGKPEKYYLSGNFLTIDSQRLIGLKDAEFVNLSPLLKSARNFIGRKKELQWFKKHCSNIGTDKASSLLIHGEAGVGKTRLIREIVTLSTDLDFKCHVCRGTPEHQNNGLFPILELMLHTLEITSSTTDQEAVRRLETELTQAGCDVQRLLPILCCWLFIPYHNDRVLEVSPQRQKAWLLQALVDWLIYLSSKQDLLLIVEDCHWIDPTSFELLNELLNQLSGVRMQLIMTSRTDLKTCFANNISVLNLKKLNKAESELLITKSAKNKKLHHSIYTTIIENADGIPLYLEELTRMLLDNYLELNQGYWRLKKNIKATSIPLNLRELLMTQLDSLSGSKETMQLAATIGREFDFSLLIQSSSKKLEELENDISELVSAELIYPVSVNDQIRYAFRHALIRDAAYQLMLDEKRQDSHAEIALALQKHFVSRINSNPSEIAFHYSSAKNPKQSSYYYIAAAKLSENNYSNKEAIYFYQQSLIEIKTITAVNSLQHNSQHKHNWYEIISSTNESLADCQIAHGEQKNGRAALDVALKNIATSETKKRSRIFRKMAKSWEYSHHHQQSLDYYHRAETSLGSLKMILNNSELLAEWLIINSGKIYVNYWDNNNYEMKHLLARMKPIVCSLGNKQQQAAFIQDELLVMYRQTRYQLNNETVKRASELVALSNTIACKELQAQASHEYGLSLLFNKKYLESKKIMKHAVLLSEKIDDAVLRCRNLTYLVVAYRMLGNTEYVNLYAKIALEQAEQVTMLDYVAAAKSNLAWVAWRNNNSHKAQQLAKEAEQHWRNLDNAYPYPFQWLGLLVLIAIELDNQTKIIKTSLLSKYVNVLTNINQQILSPKINKCLLDYQKNDQINVLCLKQAIVIAREDGFL